MLCILHPHCVPQWEQPHMASCCHTGPAALVTQIPLHLWPWIDSAFSPQASKCSVPSQRAPLGSSYDWLHSLLLLANLNVTSWNSLSTTKSLHPVPGKLLRSCFHSWTVSTPIPTMCPGDPVVLGRLHSLNFLPSFSFFKKIYHSLPPPPDFPCYKEKAIFILFFIGHLRHILSSKCMSSLEVRTNTCIEFRETMGTDSLQGVKRKSSPQLFKPPCKH